MTPRVAGVVYYLAAFPAGLAMWILLVDVFMAGPMGPPPKPFYVGVVMFIMGWLMVRQSAAR